MLRAKQKYWFVAIISAVLTLVFSALILANPFASTAVLWDVYCRYFDRGKRSLILSLLSLAENLLIKRIDPEAQASFHEKIVGAITKQRLKHGNAPHKARGFFNGVFLHLRREYTEEPSFLGFLHNEKKKIPGSSNSPLLPRIFFLLVPWYNPCSLLHTQRRCRYVVNG